MHWRVLDAGNPERCLPVELEYYGNKMQVLYGKFVWIVNKALFTKTVGNGESMFAL